MCCVSRANDIYLNRQRTANILKINSQTSPVTSSIWAFICWYATKKNHNAEADVKMTGETRFII